MEISFMIPFVIIIVLILIVIMIIPYFLSKQNQKFIDAINANFSLINTRLESDRKLEREKKVFGLQLQAYERIALFLERINPVNLIPRILQKGQSVSKFEILLVNTVREEFEHNMSQQLYISDASWKEVQLAKESIIKLINESASEINKTAPGSDLAKAILTKGFDNEIKTLDTALVNLKKEMQNNF